MDWPIECMMVRGGMPAYRRTSKPIRFVQAGPCGSRLRVVEGPAAVASGRTGMMHFR